MLDETKHRIKLLYESSPVLNLPNVPTLPFVVLTQEQQYVAAWYF